MQREKDPYKITFIYKTGFTNGIGNAKKRFGKSAGVGDKTKKMCSDVSDKVKDVYSNVSDNTCGDSRSADEKSPVNQRFLPIWSENRCVLLFP